MSTQYILLPSQQFHNELELAFVQSPDGRTIMRQGYAPLVLLDKLASTVLIVPTQRLSFHLINLPKAPAAKLRAALEGVLEELVLDDPVDLAFAIAPQAQEKNATWVAIYEKAWIKSVLDSFDLAGHKITRIIPQNHPSLTPTFEVQGNEDSPWLVRSDHTGVVASPLKLSAHLCTKLSADEIIYSPPNLATNTEKYTAKEPVIRSIGQSILHAAITDWDLAQFDIKVGGTSPALRKIKMFIESFKYEKHWGFARWGVILLLLIQIIGLNFVAWKESQQIKLKQQEGTKILQQTFPEVKLVVNAPLQMERQVDILRQTSASLGSNDLETLLSLIGSILPDEVHPTAYQYQNQELTISGLPNEAFIIQNMQAQAKQNGYELVLQGNSFVLRQLVQKNINTKTQENAQQKTEAKL
jgi:general secretion pathway protein L